MFQDLRIPPTLTLPPSLRSGNRVAQLVPRWLPLFLKGGREELVSEAHGKFVVPYCLSNLVSSKKAAFTLAEVLITLAIIGIVAAMTIPTLISNYRQKALDNQFKKTYSMLNQVLLKVQGDFGYPPKCYASGENTSEISECLAYRDKFIEELRVARICENRAYENGCIAKYNGFDTLIKDQHKDDEDYDEDYWQDYATRNCGGFNQTEILNNKKVYVLADGTILFFFSSYFYILAVDINGKQGPNKWGHDLFVFTVTNSDNNYKFRHGYCMKAEDNGLTTEQMLKKLFN